MLNGPSARGKLDGLARPERRKRPEGAASTPALELVHGCFRRAGHVAYARRLLSPGLLRREAGKDAVGRSGLRSVDGPREGGWSVRIVPEGRTPRGDVALGRRGNAGA